MFDSQAALRALIDHPLFCFALTLAAYQLALALYERTRWVVMQPVLLAMLMVIPVLLLCDIDFARYRDGTQLLSLFSARPRLPWRCRCISTCGGFASCSGRLC